MSESVSDESVFDSFRLSAIVDGVLGVAWCVDPCSPRWTKVNGKQITFQLLKRVKAFQISLFSRIEK